MHNTSFNVKKSYFTDSQLISIDLCCLTFKCDNFSIFLFLFRGQMTQMIFQPHQRLTATISIGFKFLQKEKCYPTKMKRVSSVKPNDNLKIIIYFWCN